MMINTRYISVIAIMSSISCSSFAEEPSFYGRFDIGIAHSDAGTTTQNGKSGTVIENNLSRLGVKGESKVSDALTIVYRAEFQVNSMTYADETFSPRNTYLGVKSALGTVLVGRNDTVFKTSKGGAETFALTNAAYNRMIAGQVRKADGITYYSPKISDLFTVNSTYLVDDNYESSNESQYAVSIVLGDSKLKANSYYAALAYNTIAGVDAYRAVYQQKMGNLKLAGIYQNTKSQKFEDKQGDTYFLAAVYNLNGVNLKAEYAKDKAGFGKYFKNNAAVVEGSYDKATDVDIDSLTLGVDYRLSKSTRVAAHYAMYQGEYRINNAGPLITLEDDNVASISLRYDF
ncbi:porin [Shewanella sp. Scap07]|nr:porin [Shewanella sp. Scap07]